MAKSPVALLYDHVGSRFMKYLADGSEALLGVAAKIRNAAGTVINPATDERLTDAGDANNTTTTNLAADGVYTGTGTDVSDYRALRISVYSDVDSAADGIEIQISQNGFSYATVYKDTVLSGTAAGRTILIPVLAKYHRIKYTNGPTATTTFAISTTLMRFGETQLLQPEGTTHAHVTQGQVVGGINGERKVNWLRLNEDDELKVAVAQQPEEPIFVTLTAGNRSYYHNNLVNIDEPAQITTGADEPYDVGGDTLTIAVDGGSNQTPTFATRAAQAGVHFSAPYPRTENPDHEKLKVSVDGGALEEVKIGKGLTSGAAIAAALQTEIRAIIENGSGVTVEYDTAEYPYRYVFKSGTTGTSSSIHVEKGGDDLAKKVLFVGTAFGGTERIGLAADNYWAFEVVAFLSENLSDMQVTSWGDGVSIETITSGSSASLQVTAGGANTALQFPTTLVSGTTGSGDDDLGVDGSSAAVRYAVLPPAGRKFVVDELRFYIRDDGVALNKFAGQNVLTNGVKLEVKNEGLGLIPVFLALTTADLITQANEGTTVDNGWPSGGQDLVKAVFNFSPGLTIQAGTVTNLVVTVQDDLTGLDGIFEVRASGWVEGEV